VLTLKFLHSGSEEVLILFVQRSCKVAQVVQPCLLARDFVDRIQMAYLNGKELIKKVRALYPVIKTVLISAYQREETGEDDESLLNAYLNKPIELGSLKRLLQDITENPVPSEAHPS